MNADLRWTGLWQPEITGTLEVDTLTFDKTVIGQVQASSTLLPGQSDLQVSMVVDSLRSAPAGYERASNQIVLTGNMMFPVMRVPERLTFHSMCSGLMHFF